MVMRTWPDGSPVDELHSRRAAVVIVDAIERLAPSDQDLAFDAIRRMRDHLPLGEEHKVVLRRLHVMSEARLGPCPGPCTVCVEARAERGKVLNG